MHSDLPATKLRGYVQLSTTAVPGTQVPLVNPNGTPVLMPDGVTQALGVDKPHYLGPIIVAQGKVAGLGAQRAPPKPVRITFYNLLPNSASGGNLLLPVDETRSRRRARARAAWLGRRQVHPEPGDHPPPRQQHRVDQRRQHPPVDLRRLVKSHPTRRASARGTCRTWARLATLILRLPAFPATVLRRRAVGA